MARKIDFARTDNDENEVVQIDNRLNEMEGKVKGFCQVLLSDAEQFNGEQVCKGLVAYIGEYHRILYSPISNTIYKCYQECESDEASKKIGSMLSNTEAVISYTKTQAFVKLKEESSNPQDYEDASKAILKIWDHISLAQQQYSMLKKSDEEYKKQVEDMLVPVKEDITKDMNAQLITMVGIFTALAFLIFGGISSLDNIFINIELPILKLMIIGCVWGMCILNLVFVFLFCIAKMTKLNFKSTEDINANIFQKYPIVWWSNLIIASIMLLSMWGYYITKKNIYKWFDSICFENPMIVTIGGTITIIVGIIFVMCKLIKAMKDNK